MALTLANRIQETTTTTGTGTITLAGAVSGYQSFAVVGNGNTTYYTITSGTAWEVGIGTYTSVGTTLARTTILASSAAGAAITLAGTSTVFADFPAERAVSTDNTATLTNKTLSLEAHSTAATVTAGTNAQGQGALTNDHNIITTTANNPSGVTLPTAFVGARIVVVNKGTNPINIYPATGGNINGGTANAAIACAVGASVTFVAISTTAWYTVSGYNTTGAGFVPTSQGGTGLSGSAPFSANKALYTTSTTALTTGNLPVAAGGTGVATTPANGQLLIGNGTGYTVANLSAGSNISISNSAGGITISASGGSSGLAAPTSTFVFFGSTVTISGTTADRFIILFSNIRLSSNGTLNFQFNNFLGAITSGYMYANNVVDSSQFSPSAYTSTSSANIPLTLSSVNSVYPMSGYLIIENCNNSSYPSAQGIFNYYTAGNTFQSMEVSAANLGSTNNVFNFTLNTSSSFSNGTVSVYAFA